MNSLNRNFTKMIVLFVENFLKSIIGGQTLNKYMEEPLRSYNLLDSWVRPTPARHQKKKKNAI